MAQRTRSRPVKKARHAKKDNSSAKKAKVVVAESRSRGKAEYTDNKSRSAEVKAPKTKPNRSRFSPAAKAKITQSKGASAKVKAVKGKSTLSRPGGAAKSAPHAGEPATSRAKSKSKKGNKERASVKVKGAKGKSALSRPGKEANATPQADQPVTSRATARSKIGKKESASVEATEAKAAVSRPRGKAARARYLAAELGQPVDHEGEPIGARSALLDSDADLQAYSLRLWRQVLSGGGVKGFVQAIERAGLTVDEVWTVGITDIQTTSSTPDEMRRYHQKLLFRANLLEAILSETVAELHRLPGIEPTRSTSEPVRPDSGPIPSDKAS